MENTPRLTTTSMSSSDSSPATPLSIDQALLQSPPLKRPFSDSDVKTDLSPLPPSPNDPFDFLSPTVHQASSSAIGATRTARKRTIDANMRMRRQFNPYKYRSSVWSPELRFALRHEGGATRSTLTIEEMIEVSSCNMFSL